MTDELWNVDGRRQAAKWKGRICSPAILMENRELILQTDTSSWFVNLSELLRHEDMNKNIQMTLQPERQLHLHFDCWEGVRVHLKPENLNKIEVQMKLNCMLLLKHAYLHVTSFPFFSFFDNVFNNSKTSFS